MINMNIYKIIVIIALIGFPLTGYTEEPEQLKPRGVVMFSAMHVLFDGSGYFNNRAGESGAVTGLYEFDIFAYGKVSASFKMDQRTVYGGKGRNRTDPQIIQYLPVDLLYLKYDTGFGHFGFVADHECYNYINKEVETENRYRWYGAGLKFQSYGMSAGSADWNTGAASETGFQFLNNVNYRFYASRSMKTVAYPYKYFFEADVRYDILRLYHMVPYAAVSARAVVADDVLVARACESGVRIVFPDVTLTPYAAYNYRYDIDTYRGMSSSFKMIGFRVEKSFTDDDLYVPSAAANNNAAAKKSTESPQIHYLIGYRRYFANRDFGYSAVSDIRLDALTVRGFTLYGESGLTHYSSLRYSDLYPRWIEYSMKGGIYYAAESLGQLINLSYSDVLFRQGDFLNPGSPGYNVLNLVLQSAGMDPGLEYRRRAGGESMYPALFDIVNWKLSAGKIVRDKNTGVQWIFSADVRWNLADFNKTVLYLQPGTELVRSYHTYVNYSCETGVRILTSSILNLYARYQYRHEVVTGHTGRDSSVCVGIKLER